MAKFELQEGKGRIFKVRERKTDRHPHFTGNALYKGEEIQISGWATLGDDGKLQSIGLTVQEPRSRDEKPAKQVSSSNDEWGI